ncbi:MAG: DUF6445 family protein, partial [Gammaproteobacteria bacterium]
MNYSVNRAAKPYFSHVGQDKTPVFILDNFLENVTQDLLSDIDNLVFDESPTYYPGIRAKLPEQYILSVARACVPLLQQVYAIPADHKVQFFDSYYSLVTSAPQDLSVEQRIPHFDGADPYRFALLH